METLKFKSTSHNYVADFFFQSMYVFNRYCFDTSVAFANMPVQVTNISNVWHFKIPQAKEAYNFLRTIGYFMDFSLIDFTNIRGLYKLSHLQRQIGPFLPNFTDDPATVPSDESDFEFIFMDAQEEETSKETSNEPSKSSAGP